MIDEIPYSMLHNYLDSLIDKLYKILPMKEKNDINLITYIKSFRRELIGGTDIVNGYNNDSKYITIINIMKYLSDNEFDNSICKREIFKCIRLIRDIQYNIKCNYLKIKEVE